MLPPIDASTGNLPPGVHPAPWPEVAARFGQGEPRAQLAAGLLAALRELGAAGCRTVLLNGSFVSAKPNPGDYDVAWERKGVDIERLDPVLRDFRGRGDAMKAKFQGDLFPADAITFLGVPFREFLQRDRLGRPKGIISIDLRTLP